MTSDDAVRDVRAVARAATPTTDRRARVNGGGSRRRRRHLTARCSCRRSAGRLGCGDDYKFERPRGGARSPKARSSGLSGISVVCVAAHACQPPSAGGWRRPRTEVPATLTRWIVGSAVIRRFERGDWARRRRGRGACACMQRAKKEARLATTAARADVAAPPSFSMVHCSGGGVRKRDHTRVACAAAAC